MSLGVNSGVPLPTHYFQSFCQQIAAGVLIPVEDTSTVANVSSGGQRFFDNLMTSTTFNTGVLRWNSNDNFAEYLPVVFQPFKELSPCCITNAFS